MNSYIMHEDHLLLMKILSYRFLCDTDKTGSHSFRLWRATDIRGI